MARPLVIAHHLVWTTYGTWLPNDPRGSGSYDVRRVELAEFGDAHLGRKRVQPAGHSIRDFYRQATSQLQHPPVRFDAARIASIVCGLAAATATHRYTVYACAVMPDHVHIVVRKHRDRAEEMLANFKALCRERLVAEGLHETDRPLWTAGDGWKVFLEHPDDVRRVIAYAERNPQRRQRWEFVTPYDGWPLHPGHSPNSPYARALRAAGRYPR